MYKHGESIVRILEVSLKNYKNISNSTIKTAEISNIENNTVDICGIYGQNGSGKTSIINAVGLIKTILMGDSLPKDVHEHITYGEKETEIEILFYIKNNDKKHIVTYKIIILKDDGGSFIKEESLYYRSKLDDEAGWNRQRALIINDNNKSYISPKYRSDEILKLYQDNSDFKVNKKIKYQEKKSYIFSEELIKLINKNSYHLKEEYQILAILRYYSFSNLFVVDNRQLALSDANILLPMNFKNYKRSEVSSLGVMPIPLEQATYLPEQVINEIESILKSSNKVISVIVPGLTIHLKDMGARTKKSGEKEISVELLSCRNKVEIPLRCESDGIKKIIAFIHLLIAMFNNNSMTVLIDELDSGVFEYLLGEILEILEQKGKGQLIFTSHNLRPLEVLNKNSLVFTTTNPKNRYIKLKNIKTNNNLRDVYYRDIILGGQDEVIYDKTSSAKIARAFRKAGE